MTTEEQYTKYEGDARKFRNFLKSKKYKEAYALFDKNPEVITNLTLYQLRNFYKEGVLNKISPKKVKKLGPTIEKFILGNEIK